MPENPVQVPSSAVADADDLLEPTKKLLVGLNVLPAPEKFQAATGFASAFKSPPESVSLIEAGATAASKWWAAGLGAFTLAAWGAVRPWWTGTDLSTQNVALWVAAVVTAAAAVGIAYLLGSDIRGRAAVATETVRARAAVAEAFIRAAVSVRGSTAAGAGVATEPLRIVALPALAAKHRAKAGNDENDWLAVALATDGKDETRYLVVKGSVHEWVAAAQIEFVP